MGPHDFAFPIPELNWSNGMSLCDYFAAHAPAVPDDFGWADGETDSWQRQCRWRFHYADAMLCARNGRAESAQINADMFVALETLLASKGLNTGEQSLVANAIAKARGMSIDEVLKGALTCTTPNPEST